VAGSRYNKATLALAYSQDTSPRSNPTWIREKKRKENEVGVCSPAGFMCLAFDLWGPHYRTLPGYYELPAAASSWSAHQATKGGELVAGTLSLCLGSQAASGGELR